MVLAWRPRLCSDLGCVASYLSANVITVGRFQHPISRKGRPAAVLVFLLLPSASRIAALAIANTSVARLAPRCATSFGSRPVANRAHCRSNLDRSASGRSRGAITGWMLAWGIRGACQIISEHFWIDGGECGEGRAVSLVAARPRRVLLLWCISGSRAIPGHCRAIHVPSSLLNGKGIERGWP